MNNQQILRSSLQLLLHSCSVPHMASLANIIRRNVRNFVECAPATPLPLYARLSDLQTEIDNSAYISADLLQRCCDALLYHITSNSLLIIASEVEPLLDAINNWNQLDENRRRETLREVGHVCFVTGHLLFTGEPVENGFQVFSPVQHTVTFDRVVTDSGVVGYRILIR